MDGSPFPRAPTSFSRSSGLLVLVRICRCFFLSSYQVASLKVAFFDYVPKEILNGDVLLHNACIDARAHL